MGGGLDGPQSGHRAVGALVAHVGHVAVDPSVGGPAKILMAMELMTLTISRDLVILNMDYKIGLIRLFLVLLSGN